MTKYNVVLELDTKQFTNIIAGLNRLITDDTNVIGEFPHLATDSIVSKHMHEMIELREYIRSRYIDAEVMPDENNPAG